MVGPETIAQGMCTAALKCNRYMYTWLS